MLLLVAVFVCLGIAVGKFTLVLASRDELYGAPPPERGQKKITYLLLIPAGTTPESSSDRLALLVEILVGAFKFLFAITALELYGSMETLGV